MPNPKIQLATVSVALAVGALLVTPAVARTIDITIESNQALGGLYLTPLFTALHDGTYDAFNSGSAASDGVSLIAEEGDPSLEAAAASAYNINVITAPGGFAGAPVIDPGESATIRINTDFATDRYLSFLSMIIPSNDTFIGNDNPLAYELFNAAGEFTNLSPIQIFAQDAWDAGTEVNNLVGAAFSAAGGVGTDEFGVIGNAGDLSFLIGQDTAAGTRINSVPFGQELLATITVSQVPLPAGLPLLALALGGLGLVRRSRKS